MQIISAGDQECLASDQERLASDQERLASDQECLASDDAESGPAEMSEHLAVEYVAINDSQCLHVCRGTYAIRGVFLFVDPLVSTIFHSEKKR